MAQATLQSAAVAVGTGTQLPVTNADSVQLIISGPFNATLIIEGTSNGTTWTPIEGVGVRGNVVTQIKSVQGDPVALVYDVSGFTAIRANVTTYVQGAITVKAGTIHIAPVAAGGATGAALDGTDMTTPVPAMPAGGAGIRGWLSAIWTRLNALVTGVTPSTLVVTALSTVNTAVTASLPNPGAGLFHYITRIVIERVATAAVTGTAVLGYTSTNLAGPWARSTGNAIAAGGQVIDVDEVLVSPLKSSVAGTATTIVAPAGGAAVQIRITVYYYTGA